MMHGQANIKGTQNFFKYMALAYIVLKLRLSKPVWLANRAVDSKGPECREIYSIKVAHDELLGDYI